VNELKNFYTHSYRNVYYSYVSGSTCSTMVTCLSIASEFAGKSIFTSSFCLSPSCFISESIYFFREDEMIWPEYGHFVISPAGVSSSSMPLSFLSWLSVYFKVEFISKIDYVIDVKLDWSPFFMSLISLTSSSLMPSISCLSSADGYEAVFLEPSLLSSEFSQRFYYPR